MWYWKGIGRDRCPGSTVSSRSAGVREMWKRIFRVDEVGWQALVFNVRFASVFEARNGSLNTFNPSR